MSVRMLSIQAHPDGRQAEGGFAARERGGIAVHQPEAQLPRPEPQAGGERCADRFLDPARLKPPDEIADLLDQVAELRPLMPDFRTRLRELGNDEAGHRRLLRTLYEVS